MPRRPQARHIAAYAHPCGVTGGDVGVNRAIRWAPVSRRPVRQKPPSCPYCGATMQLEAVAYQGAADDAWDFDLERTRVIVAALAKEGDTPQN